MSADSHPGADLYRQAAAAHGPALQRLAYGYEADADKRRDLLQEIHLQLWRSLAVYDGRCSLRTWTFRVAHNTAATWVLRERRGNAPLVALEDLEHPPAGTAEPDIDLARARDHLAALIRTLAPLDRQIILGYLEELDLAAIADITGLTTAHVSVKIHRIRKMLARRFQKEHSDAG